MIIQSVIFLLGMLSPSKEASLQAGTTKKKIISEFDKKAST